MEEKTRLLNDLLSRINHLNSRKTLLETAIYFDKEKYFQDHNETVKNGIIQMQRNINDIVAELSPLLEKIRELKCGYHVQYQGRVYDPILNSYRWNIQTEVFYLITCCDIDTFINGWSQYISDPCVASLIQELADVIWRLRYSEYQILNISRIP